MQQIFNLDLSIYQKGNDIGNGSFGLVYKVHKKENPKKIFAAKELIKVTNKDSKTLEDLLNELKINAEINHPSIIKFIGFNRNNFDNDEKPTIITEYYPEGSLENFLKMSNILIRRKISVSIETQEIIILYGIASAMKYLHEHNIIHRDLKPENILLDKNLYPIICDFGISKYIEKDESDEENEEGFKGTLLYSAPEAMNMDEHKYSEKSDVYSFALIAYEIMLREEPFKDVTKRHVLYQKVTGGERPEFTKSIPNSYKNLIEKCWSQNPDDRPTFEDIMKELKEDSGFITPKIDEVKYHDYIFMLDQTPTYFIKVPDLSKDDFDKLDPKEMV